jgi:hypothetical protein
VAPPIHLFHNDHVAAAANISSWIDPSFPFIPWHVPILSPFCILPLLCFMFLKNSINSCHHQFESAKPAKVLQEPGDRSMNWYQQFKIQHGFKLSLILVGSEI